jgi:hypothetical protein
VSIYIGEITADVAAAKSEVLELSLRYQEVSAKPTLKMRGRTAASGTQRTLKKLNNINPLLHYK